MSEGFAGLGKKVSFVGACPASDDPWTTSALLPAGLAPTKAGLCQMSSSQNYQELL